MKKTPNRRVHYDKVVDYYPLSIYPVFVTNHLARPFVYLLSHTRIRPNTITLLSLLTFCASASLFYSGYVEFGAVIFHIAFLLDCIDGKFARYLGKTSSLGAWMDTMVDRIGISANSLALALNQTRYGAEYEWMWFFLFVINRERAKGLDQKTEERSIAEKTWLYRKLYRFRDAMVKHKITSPPVGTVEVMIFLFFFAPLFGIVDLAVRISVILLFFLHSTSAFFYWRKEMFRRVA
jgi:hypothetical protein